jgi:hypothetical protein
LGTGVMMSGMRALRPTRLVGLPSGLWALDVVQPVAAVLDPSTGEVRRLVSWRDVPAPPVHGGGWPPPRVCSDGEGLWIQHERSGPLVRVTVDGVVAAVWTGGLHLAVAGPGAAWCAQWASTQEVISGESWHGGPTGPDSLLHVSASGSTRLVRTEGRVRNVYATDDAAWVALDVEPWSLRELGAGTAEVVWSTGWLRLPWGEPPPETVLATQNATPDGPPEAGLLAHEVRRVLAWQDLEAAADAASGEWSWWVGWPAGQRSAQGNRRQVVATAARVGGDGRHFALGAGVVYAVAQVEGDGLAVAVARGPFTGPHCDAQVDLLRLDAGSGSVTVLAPAGSIDVTTLCRPTVARPLEAGSYEARVLASYGDLDAAWVGPDRTRPLAVGMSAARARLVGLWPSTQLERTFAFDGRPGLRLRRLVPLYDELGRIAEPEFTDIHLMEDLETGALPPASEAVDGVLDI